QWRSDRMQRMRPQGSAAELERRRRRAVALMEQGDAPTVSARILGSARPALYRWRQLACQRPQGVAARRHPGPALDGGAVSGTGAVAPAGRPSPWLGGGAVELQAWSRGNRSVGVFFEKSYYWPFSKAKMLDFTRITWCFFSVTNFR